MDSSFTSFFPPILEMDTDDGRKQFANDHASFVDSILSHTPMVNPVAPLVNGHTNGVSNEMNQQQMMAMMMNFFLTQMGQPTITNNVVPLPVPPVAPSSIIVSDAAKKSMNNSSMTELELDGVSPISSDSFSSDEYSSPSSPQSIQYNHNTPTIDYRTTNPSLFSAINPNTNNNNITNTTYSAPSEQYSVGAVAPSSLLLPQSNDKKKGTKRSTPTPPVKEESDMSTIDKPIKSRTKKTTASKRGQKRSAVESDSEYDSCNDSDDENNSSSSSSSSSLPASLQDLLTEVDEKKRRLARKAELARMSRRRKKMRLHDLEKEVDRLNKELAALKKHAKGIELEKAQATAAVNDEETEYKKLMSLMNEFVSAAKSDNNNNNNFNLSSSTLLDNFVASHTQFINNGQYHLNALSYHVSPILPFEFLNWMCTQNEKFYEESAGLWKALLVDELKLNDDQMTDMDTLRHTIRKQFKHVAEIEKQFKRLNDAMTKQNIFAIQNLERIRAVLTPAQFAHYIDWVQKFGAICLKISV